MAAPERLHVIRGRRTHLYKNLFGARQAETGWSGAGFPEWGKDTAPDAERGAGGGENRRPRCGMGPANGPRSAASFRGGGMMQREREFERCKRNIAAEE